MKTSKLIGLTSLLTLSLLTAACSAPPAGDAQASWNNHDWVDRAETNAPIHGGDVMISNAARGGD